MNTKPDIVSLKWVIGLINAQADAAEAALVEYGRDPEQKQALLRCMWSVHQITSTFRALGMRKAEMLTLEMERSLNFLYKGKILPDRSKLTMGGLMQGLKIIPAYLENTEKLRVDAGLGLEQFVNDLRRWGGERPRPKAYFFYMDIPEGAGITEGASPASAEEIKSRANVMLVLYLEMAKQALRKIKVGESMKTVARVARKMQTLFAGTTTERYWLTMIGLCEGIAGGLIVPDECIAQIFKSGAFAIKYARENGDVIDANVDYDGYLMQMLYYIASCKSKPVHITRIREIFGIDNDTVREAYRWLVHSDAIVISLRGALERVNRTVEFIAGINLAEHSTKKGEDKGASVLEDIEGAEQRLIAVGQMHHVDSLKSIQRQLKQFLDSNDSVRSHNTDESVSVILRGLTEVRLDLEYKLQHGLNSCYAGKEYELRETVVTATFKQMAMVENYLHQILRRKALKSALDKKPKTPDGVLRLTTALKRHLNKTEEGHAELRQAIRDADIGVPDADLLYELSLQFLDELEGLSDRQAITESLELLLDIAGALHFAGMEREGSVIEVCRTWLAAASDAGSVHEDEAFGCFADAFAQIELHLQRSIVDPLDDTSHILELAEQRAAALTSWKIELSPGRTVVDVCSAEVKVPEHAAAQVQDADIPAEFRDVFIEESEEMVAELGELTTSWLQDPGNQEVLRDIRRHFHTFKGNGRAVGANVLGELGWAAQDLLDRSLEGEIEADASVQTLVHELVGALPGLVRSYAASEGPDVGRIRELTNACFELAAGSEMDNGGAFGQVTEITSNRSATGEPQTAAKTLAS